jgi:segregation and condensation protein A
VSLQVATHQTLGYQVSTPIYEGPLDLLLALIERAELDITALAIAQVTNQYLAYMETLKERDAASVSAFLVIAARLVQIKSAALLPKPPAVSATSQEEDPGEALARQLIQYRRFKQLAGFLAGREAAGLHTFLRVAPPEVKVETRLDLSGLTLEGLIQAARDVFLSKPALTDLSKVVSMPRVTIRDKIKAIFKALKAHSRIKFRSLLKTNNRIEVVVTFLAMLELVKRHIVDAQQESLFGEIEIQTIADLEDPEEFETDFTE